MFNGHSVFLWPGHNLRSYFLPENAASGKRLDAVFGQVLLLRWCLIFAFHCGHVRPLRRVVADEHPLFQTHVFQGLFDWDLLYKHFDPLCGLSLIQCYQLLVWHHCHHVGQCVMAALSPPRLFAAWRIKAPFFRGFPFRWVPHSVMSLTRGVIVLQGRFS